MPHQCLKCGSVFADGSPQILRGCQDCGGTRFFFTEKRMSDDERDKLKERANRDIKHLIQEMMTGDNLPIKFTEDEVKGEEWVEFKIIDEEEQQEAWEEGKKADSSKQKISVSGPIEVRKDMVKSVEELIFPQERGSRRFKFVSKAEAKKIAEEAKKTEKSAVIKPTTETQSKKVSSEERVAVISIDEDGVYNIDVEKLLEHSPIIVQKDGSYMVHLPSVFKKGRKKGSMA